MPSGSKEEEDKGGDAGGCGIRVEMWISIAQARLLDPLYW